MPSSHIYDAGAAGVTISRSVAGPIEREVAISRAAGVKAWASEDEIRRYTTWQVQQMRRVMRSDQGSRFLGRIWP